MHLRCDRGYIKNRGDKNNLELKVEIASIMPNTAIQKLFILNTDGNGYMSP